MRTFTVHVETKGSETYVVEAESEEQAREIWSDSEPDISEVRDAWITDVEEVDE